MGAPSCERGKGCELSEESGYALALRHGASSSLPKKKGSPKRALPKGVGPTYKLAKRLEVNEKYPGEERGGGGHVKRQLEEGNTGLFEKHRGRLGRPPEFPPRRKKTGGD